MTQAPTNGGPAFPTKALSKGDHGYPVTTPGMTLHDYAVLAALPFCQKICWDDNISVERNADLAVAWAEAYADAMLAARKGGAA